MAAQLDQMVTIGEEASYSSTAIGTRGVLTRSDNWSDEVQEISADGARAGRQAMFPSQNIHVFTGGSGQIEVPMTVSGMSMICRHLLGAAAIASVSKTTGKRFTVASSPAGPKGSYTFWVRRVASDGKKHSSIYSGCMVTGWTLACSTGQAAVLTVNYDFADSSTTVGDTPANEPVPVYSDGRVYTWVDLALSVDGSPFAVVTDFEFTVNNMLNTDRRYLKGTRVKSEPVRQGVPEFSGTMTAHLDDTGRELADKWAGDGTFALTATFTAADVNIASDPSADTVMPTAVLTLPVVKPTGSTPQFSLDSLTEISVPFMAYMPSSGNAATLELVASDTAWE